MSRLRQTWLYEEGKSLKQIQFGELRKGDVFKLLDVDETGTQHPEAEEKGDTVFVADSDARLDHKLEKWIVEYSVKPA